MNKILLKGRLGKKFGKSWELNVRTPKEALVAINANTDGEFFSYLIKTAKENNIEYKIVVGDIVVDKDKIHVLDGPCGKDDIQLIPVIGGNWEQFVIQVIIAVVLAAASSLLAPRPEANLGSAEEKGSELFNGGPQPARQGKPVPLGYGRLLIHPITASVQYVYEHETVKADRYRDSVKVKGKGHVLDVLCEGPIKGLVNEKNSILIDEAPMTNLDLTYDSPEREAEMSFNIERDFRTGEYSQSQIASENFSQAKVPIPIPSSNQIKVGKPVSFSFNSKTYPDASKMIVNIKFGTTGYALEDGGTANITTKFKIALTLNNKESFVDQTFDVKGKSQSGFVFSYALPLYTEAGLSTHYWTYRIERVDQGWDNNRYYHDTYLDSVIIETQNRFRYPNTALCALSFEAKHFPSIPVRQYHLDLLKVKVPDNYTPTVFDEKGRVARDELGNITGEALYSGPWLGNFKDTLEWTNNPAWILYDLLTNKRYGLGEFIKEENLHKWSFYNIAKYCDELVDDGFGDKEPRFTCNTLISSSMEAYTLINYLCSVFRGISYWMSGLVFPVQDRPKLSSQLFTNTDVIDGKFNHSSSERGLRRTVALVQWNDRDDSYKHKIEYVEDPEGVLRYGVRELEMAEFACTSRGQAHRAGKWALMSERLENQIITFEVGMKGLYARPGDVIEIYDDYRLKKRLGGRTLDMNPECTTVTLDRYIEIIEGVSYRLILSIPKASKDASSITSSDESEDFRTSFLEERDIAYISVEPDKTIVSIHPDGEPFSERVIGGTWTIQPISNLSKIPAAKKYRVLSLAETEEKNIKITALEYSLEKFGLSETGYSVITESTTDYSETPIASPAELILEGNTSWLNASFESVDNVWSAKIVATFTGSSGPFLNYHTGRGRPKPTVENPDPEWTPLNIEKISSDPLDKSYRAWMNFNQPGDYQIEVWAVQVGGGVSVDTDENGDFIYDSNGFHVGSINGEIVNPLGESPNGTGPDSVMPVAAPTLVNRLSSDDPTIYKTKVPIFDIRLSSTEAVVSDDPRYPFLDSILVRIKDSNGNVKSDWIEVDDGEQFTIPYSNDFIYSADTPLGSQGWPFREGIIEAKTIDVWGQEGHTVQSLFNNPSIDVAGLILPNVTPNSFDYEIEPTGNLHDDFIKVLFFVSDSEDFTGVAPISASNALSGTINHGLGISKAWVKFALVDNFDESDYNMSPVRQIQLNTAGYPIPPEFNLELHDYFETDSLGNEHKMMYATWDRDDVLFGHYDLRLEEEGGEVSIYSTPQCEVGEIPRYIFPVHSTNKTYKCQVRSRFESGIVTGWSEEASATISRPKLKTLVLDNDAGMETKIISSSTQNATLDVAEISKTKTEIFTITQVDIDAGYVELSGVPVDIISVEVIGGCELLGSFDSSNPSNTDFYIDTSSTPTRLVWRIVGGDVYGLDEMIKIGLLIKISYSKQVAE